MVTKGFHRGTMFILALILVVIASSNNAVQAQTQSGAAFTYQGSLSDGGNPANGPYDFQFRLYTDVAQGTQVGPILSKEDVSVTLGLFAVTLDFGAVFDGTPRYLELAVRPGTSTGEFALLAPRQALTAAPMAVFSNSANGLQNRSVSSAAPITGQVLKWDGSQWVPAADEPFLAGNGGSPFAARSDHNHFGQAWVDSNSFAGLLVRNNGTGRAVEGQSVSGFAIAGFSDSNLGVFGDGGTGRGVEGHGNEYGVFGFGGAGRGVEGQGGNAGVFGSSGNYGVYGEGGVVGVFGEGINGARAGEFSGDVAIFGTLSKTAGSFKIDHPLDPANKYLSHSFVESPDMMNIYNGNVTLGSDGTAKVELPDYFEALNKEFRYQLTAIGAPGPNLYIAEEIKDNHFKIAGGSAGMKVSWQVTGIRNDAYAQAHRIQVEEDKPRQERNTYIYPQGFGQPETSSVTNARQQIQKSAPSAQSAQPTR